MWYVYALRLKLAHIFMESKKPFINAGHLPDDIFSYHDEQFYDFIKKYIGKKQADLLEFEEISSADIYLNCGNVLAILDLDSTALLPFKESLCLKLDNHTYTILPGIKSSFTYLTELLIKKKTEIARSLRQNRINFMSSNFSLTTATNANDTTSISNSNSTTIVSESSQYSISTHNITKAGDRHKNHIISAINQWIEKNKKNFGDNYFKLIPGTDYSINITINPDAAIIRCACGTKSALQLVNKNYQVNVPISESMVMS